MRIAGSISLVVAFAFVLAAIVLMIAGLRTRRTRLARTGLVAVWGALTVALAAAAMLVAALLEGDTTFLYVQQNWDPDLSLPYRLAAFWAGAEGSLLLWAVLLLAGTTVVAVAAWRSSESALLRRGAVLVLSCVLLVLLGLLVFDEGSAPFLAAPDPGADPVGLNPLLLHPAMALHPPALFLGYVGLAVPFAYALSALASGRLGVRWTVLARGWALAGWTFLSLGIGLGAWWAYVILSWGGYWGWDPVENTSLVPWLTATALLHTLHVYRRGSAFRRWTVVLAPLTFWCTILAAWTTRTGVVASVHAFAQRSLLLVVLSALLGIVAAVTCALAVWRWRALADGRGSGTGGGRHVLYELLPVALVLFAGALLFATIVVPLAFGQTVRPRTYDMLAQPLGVVTVLGVGLCALLGSARVRGADQDTRRWTWWWALPVGAGVVAGVLLATAGAASSAVGLIGLSACVFAAVATAEWLWSLWRRRRSAGRGATAALVATLRSRTLGGVLVHVGLTLAVAGLIGAGLYSERQRLSFEPVVDAEVAIGDYRLTLAGARLEGAPQGGERVVADLEVRRGGGPAGRVGPALDYYAKTGQTVARADILGSPWQDLFVSPVAYGEDGVIVEAIVFPLVRLIWAGAGLLVVGGIVALWPRRGSGVAGESEER